MYCDRYGRSFALGLAFDRWDRGVQGPFVPLCLAVTVTNQYSISQGTKIHSAAYPGTAEDQTGKKVAVIGSGSSSIQIVPALQPYATQVDNYVRGSAWIASPFASTELLKRKPDGNNYQFSEEEKKAFEEDPQAYKNFRQGMEAEVS